MKEKQLAPLAVFILVAAFLWYLRAKWSYRSVADFSVPAGYKITLSPPLSATNTWITFDGSTLLVPLRVCGKTVSAVLDTGSARLVVMDTAACGPTRSGSVNLSYGSMQVSTRQTTGPVEIQLGTLNQTLQMPTAYFADSCTSGTCANILGLMPPESNGTFPQDSFCISFDGRGGGWFALYPTPPSSALAIPYTVSQKGFYTLEDVVIVDSSSKPKRRHAVVDSGTTLAVFPDVTQVDISQEVSIYTPDMKVLLVKLQPNQMDSSSSVTSTFPAETFVLGLPFFNNRHVAFTGSNRLLHIWD